MASEYRYVPSGTAAAGERMRLLLFNLVRQEIPCGNQYVLD